jgi:hypothetical protein
METYKLSNGKTLQVIQDDYAESPRHDDNLGTMICFHRRYDLGDKHNYSHKDYSGWSEMKSAIEKNENVAVILPLYLYDHSGITISTSPFSCPWDSGQIGFTFVSKKKLREEYRVKRITKEIIERATKILLAEVETYDTYIRGEVYGFKVVDENGQVEDSCWGFFGSDIETNGILEHIDAEIVG